VKIRQHFCGEFNFQRVRFIEYCYAFTARQAWLVFCRRIAKKQGVLPRITMSYFNGEKDNYKITIETEFTEDTSAERAEEE